MSLFNVSEAGIITVDSVDIEEQFIEAYKQALGANLNTEAGTFQGQMILNDTAMLTYAQNQCALIGNAFSAYSATGAALDVVAGFWGYYRKQGVATVVNCTVTGTVGTIIPAGSLVSDGEHQFAALDTVTIPAGGSVNAQFQCTESGAIVCLSNTVTDIVTVIDGWDTVTNQAKGITGYETESDNDFRARITANWFNIRGRGALGAIIDNMAQLDNVISVLGRENPTNANMIIDGITLKPHSVYICIAGGSSSDIAETMYNQKTIGADTNGTTSVAWYDESTGLTNTYHIQRPTMVNLRIQVNYAPTYFTPADIQDKIKTAIMGFIESNALTIGQRVSGNWLAQAFDGFDYASILSVKIGVESGLSLTILQTSGSNLSDIEVDGSIFETKIGASGTYAFSYDGSNWSLNSETVDLAKYGISFDGTPASGNELTVVYTSGFADFQNMKINEMPILENANIIGVEVA